MKRALTTLLLVSIGFAVGQRTRWETADAQEGPPCAELNGDINGDLGLDISDPVALLRALFLGDEPPVPLCGGAGAGG